MVSFYRQRGLIPRRTRPLSRVETLIDPTAGTFTRSSVATYRTSSTTLAIAGVDVPRYQNLGDGNGAVAYFEGARTNVVAYANDLGNWTQAASNTGTSNAATSPDGTSNAANVVKGATPAIGPYLLGVNIGATAAGTLSLWCKNNGGGSTSRLTFSFNTGIRCEASLTSSWQRISVYATFTGATNSYVSFDHRVNVPNPGDPAISSATNFYVYGVQLEAALFASSAIITTGAAATRATDIRTLTTAQYKSRVATDPSQGYFIPAWGSSQTASGQEFWIHSFGGANSGLRLRNNAGAVKLECVDGGSVQVASNTLTYNPFQKISYIQRPSTGTIEISGATTGNGAVVGSSFAYDASTCRIGGILSGSSEAFAAISPLVSI